MLNNNFVHGIFQIIENTHRGEVTSPLHGMIGY